MHLYQGTSEQFIADATQARIANQLADRFFAEFRYRPAPSEVTSWNAKSDAKRLGPGIPKSDFWASANEGIDQVGCVYTAQGFEFDYVGVIVGPDLVYRPMEGGWKGQRDQSHDRVVRSGVTEQEFTDFVKSTYRVLLTCGLRGCYVYFMDAPTRDFFLSRVERRHEVNARAAESSADYANDEPRRTQ
ncbi:MAG: DUF2075 domain-containing protein [Chloroflexi bacterium]|nr:DUF2075 domain-containing protein [Chloroflexota bacterium]